MCVCVCMCMCVVCVCTCMCVFYVCGCLSDTETEIDRGRKRSTERMRKPDIYRCRNKTESNKLAYITTVHFKGLGSRHILKGIKLQKAMTGIEMTLCKTDLILIRRHTYKCNTFSDVDFEVFLKSAYVPLWYSQFQEQRALIRRHIYNYNTFSDVDFEVFSKSAYVPLWYSQFQETACFERGWLPFR